VGAYAEWQKLLRLDGDKAGADAVKSEYERIRADIWYRCRHETRIKSKSECVSSVAQHWDALNDVCDTTTAPPPVTVPPWVSLCPDLVFDPPSGSFVSEGAIITITAPAQVTAMYYTTDGSLPSAESTPYTEPFALPEGSLMVRVAVIDPDPLFPASICDAVFYTCNTSIAFDPPTGYMFTDEEPTIVNLSTPLDGATIRYTVDGSEPSLSSTLYDGPITLDFGAGEYTIQAVVVVDGEIVAGPCIASYSWARVTLTPMCNEEDKDYAGVWGVFCGRDSTPPCAFQFEDNQWEILIENKGAPLPVARMEIWHTTATKEWTNGEAWGTDDLVPRPFGDQSIYGLYPLVLYQDNVQVNTEYHDVWGDFAPGHHTFIGYGNGRLNTQYKYWLRVVLTNGQVLEALEDVGCQDSFNIIFKDMCYCGGYSPEIIQQFSGAVEIQSIKTIEGEVVTFEHPTIGVYNPATSFQLDCTPISGQSSLQVGVAANWGQNENSYYDMSLTENQRLDALRSPLINGHWYIVTYYINPQAPPTCPAWDDIAGVAHTFRFRARNACAPAEGMNIYVSFYPAAIGCS